jgi:hypothetical protein
MCPARHWRARAHTCDSLRDTISRLCRRLKASTHTRSGGTRFVDWIIVSWHRVFWLSRADTRLYTSAMATTAEEVLKEALQLSEGERARVAAELLASLEPDVETRDGEAWIAEVERRARAAMGGLPGLSWDETRTRVEERIPRTRK